MKQIRETSRLFTNVYSMCETSPDLHAEDAGDPDCASNTLQTQRGHLWVVTVLQPHTERCKQRGPSQLEPHRHINYGR